MMTQEDSTDLLSALQAAMLAAPDRPCPCGHRAQEHQDGGCPCQDCDVRAFEVEQGSVHYRDTGERATLEEHLAALRSGSRPAMPFDL